MEELKQDKPLHRLEQAVEKLMLMQDGTVGLDYRTHVLPVALLAVARLLDVDPSIDLQRHYRVELLRGNEDCKLDTERDAGMTKWTTNQPARWRLQLHQYLFLPGNPQLMSFMRLQVWYGRYNTTIDTYTIRRPNIHGYADHELLNRVIYERHLQVPAGALKWWVPPVKGPGVKLEREARVTNRMWFGSFARDTSAKLASEEFVQQDRDRLEQVCSLGVLSSQCVPIRLGTDDKVMSVLQDESGSKRPVPVKKQEKEKEKEDHSFMDSKRRKAA